MGGKSKAPSINQGPFSVAEPAYAPLKPNLGGGVQTTFNSLPGQVDLIAQQIELHSSTAGNTPLPLAVHFRATDYLTQPHWAVAANWNRFPVAPIMELAQHMGMQFPPNLQLSGSMDGAIGYSGRGSSW